MELKLQQLRYEQNLSQEDVAKVLNITRQGYSRYERGEREANYETLCKLAELFNVSIDYLLGHSTYYYPDNLKTDSYSDEEERALIEKYRELNAPGKKLVNTVIDTHLATMAESKQKKNHTS